MNSMVHAGTNASVTALTQINAVQGRKNYRIQHMDARAYYRNTRWDDHSTDHCLAKTGRTDPRSMEIEASALSSVSQILLHVNLRILHVFSQ
jgi:hypothetical protein